MPGTKAGGLKARESNLIRHGADYYARIGSKGGKNFTKYQANGKRLKGFAVNRKLAQEAGRIGGRISRRGKAKEYESM